MKKYLYGLSLDFKLGIRNKNILLTFYVVPLLFFIMTGGVFASTNPESKDTLIQSMSIFAITMAAIIGFPYTLNELYKTDVKRAYKVGGIPLYALLITSIISTFIHIMIVGVIILILAPAIFSAKLPASMALHFTMIAIFSLLSIVIGAMIGMYCKSTSKIMVYTQLIFMPSIMLSGLMFPVELLPKPLEYIGMILPSTWGFKAMTGKHFLDRLPLIVIFVGFLTIFIILFFINTKKIGNK